MAKLLACVLAIFALAVCSNGLTAPGNEWVMIDMQQNMPGDAVGWQQSVLRDPRALQSLGYTADGLTGENSPTLAVDFSSVGAFFPAGSRQRAWLDAYGQGLDRYAKRIKGAGLKLYCFVDLMVFPTAVLEVFSNATDGRGKVVWNKASEQLQNIMFDETVARFPEIDGFIIRTGETYVFDTPYHQGNSPSNGTIELWASFISSLRAKISVELGRDLFFRQWDNWPSEAEYYLNLTARIDPHERLYFSIKHTSGDFWRQQPFNPSLGIGNHAQIVEVELQREYEGKGAFPNYVMSGVINGFPEVAGHKGLRDIIHAPQLRGLWTWTRGGGWWGPYIHGSEFWLELHTHVLALWWKGKGDITEAQAFSEACTKLLQPSSPTGCSVMREIALQSAQAVLLGEYCVVGKTCFWMRDDRLGGMDRAENHFHSLADNATLWNATMAMRKQSVSIWSAMQADFLVKVEPEISDNPVLADSLAASFEYGTRLFSWVEAGWRAMALGFRKQHHLSYSETDLQQAIVDYDNRYSAFRAFGLANPYAASLYHPYWLCIGTDCTGAFDPKPTDVVPGLAATIDTFRS